MSSFLGFSICAARQKTYRRTFRPVLSEISRGTFWIAIADAQADLDLRWAHMLEGTFSHFAAHFYFAMIQAMSPTRDVVFSSTNFYEA